ncbi:MAG: ATP phosphoribosyltransferase regulatory subunit [Chloroflexi bacterium]|nr:ATP phosphoribosyltransferase regulatory subunit [Chloroflexota bacterium]
MATVLSGVEGPQELMAMDDTMRCRGMRDVLPPAMRRFRSVEQAFRDVCQGWGYEEVRTPTIEHLHLFTAAGTLSPQMLGRVYSFLDWDGWSGQRVVLRPDSTIPTVRLYVQQMSDGGAAKLFYVQNVFHFAQGDEPREEWQCGVELIGDTQPVGDVELILIGCEVLQRLGLQPELRLSDPGILRAVLVQAGLEMAEQLALYDRILDGDVSALDEIQERLPETGGSLRALLSTEGEGVPYLNNLRGVLLPAIPDLARPLDELTAVAEVLGQTGCRYRIAPALVRNFEYYTGPAFHFQVDGTKVGGGGRYDALISLIGGEESPASGFALYLDLIAPLLPADGAQEGGAVGVRPGSEQPADLAAAFRLASALRGAGRQVDVAAGREGATVWQVVAGDGGFVLSRDGAASQRLASVDEVVRAITELGRD